MGIIINIIFLYGEIKYREKQCQPQLFGMETRKNGGISLMLTKSDTLTHISSWLTYPASAIFRHCQLGHWSQHPTLKEPGYPLSSSRQARQIKM